MSGNYDRELEELNEKAEQLRQKLEEMKKDDPEQFAEWQDEHLGYDIDTYIKRWKHWNS